MKCYDYYKQVHGNKTSCPRRSDQIPGHIYLAKT